MTSSAELNAALDEVFERLVLAEQRGAVNATPASLPAVSPVPAERSLLDTTAPTMQSTKLSHTAPQMSRGPVEDHQTFRIRRTGNGHRLPPLSSHSFEAKLEAKRAAELEKKKDVVGGALQRGSVSRSLLPPMQVAPNPRKQTETTLQPSPLRDAFGYPSNVSAPSPSPQTHHSTHSHEGGCPASSLDIHRKLCKLCAEIEMQKFDKVAQKLLKSEREDRQAIEMEHTNDMETTVMECWLYLRRLRERAKKRGQQQYDEMRHRQRQSDLVEERVMKLHKHGRREILTDWEVGFDEIAALERLSLRHLHQMKEVKEKYEMKRQHDQMVETIAEAQRLEALSKARDAAAQGQFFLEETFARTTVEKSEDSVRNSYLTVFREVKRRLQDAEAHVHAMMTRHAQRLQSIEHEKEKLKTEEHARRELMIATEKRAYDTMQQLEPDSRRKSLQAQAQRLRKQAADRAAVESDMNTTIHQMMTEEQQAFEALTEQYNQEGSSVYYRHQRKLLKLQRRRLREVREDNEKSWLKAEDDAAWHLVRHRFATSLHYPCVDEEVSSRHDLIVQKKREKDHIWDLLRVRLHLNQNENRVRKDIVADEIAHFVVFQNGLRQANDINSFFWFETVERRTIHDDWTEGTEAMKSYHKLLNEAAKLTQSCPKTRTDKCTTNPNSDIAIWLRNSTISWYYLSDDVNLLEGSTLRNGTATNTVLTEAKNVTCSVEILNAQDGDRLAYLEPNNGNDPLPLYSGQKLSGISYSGSCRDFFAAFRFRNMLPFNRFRVCPRIIKVDLNGVVCYVHIILVTPLCPLNTVSVTSRIAFPLSTFSIPQMQDYKNCRIVLTMPEAAGAGCGHRLSFQLSNDFTMHPKNGVMQQGKSVMRIKQQTEKVVEVEFEPKTAVLVRSLLQCISVVHGDDTSHLDPLSLDVYLTRRSDGSTFRVTQELDVDNENSLTPRLRVATNDLYYRLSSLPISEKCDAFVPKNPHHLLSLCTVVFPASQPDVMGGMLKITLQNPDGFTTLSMHWYNNLKFHLDKDCHLYMGALTEKEREKSESVAEDLLRSATEVEQNHQLALGGAKSGLDVDFVASVHGLRSTALLIKFNPDKAITPKMVNDILRAVTVVSSRTSLPKKGEVSMTLALRIDVGLSSDPIDHSFKLTIAPPVLECAAKNGGFPYREGAGPKALPSLSMRPIGGLLPALSPEAILQVSIVEGAEDSDEIDVTDCEVRCGELLHLQNGQVIARIRRISSHAIQLFIGGQYSNHDWLRKRVDDAYNLACTSSSIASKFDVNPQHINVLLRSIRYNCNSVDPQEDSKMVLLTLDDGRTGRSSTVLDLAIETVDDPTDIIIEDPPVEYRQNSSKALLGCACLPNLRLEDIDSDNFHGGYIVVEHCSGPSEIGDHIYFLTPKQQEQFLFRDKGKSAVSALQRLVECTGSVADDVPALTVVVDEQPQPLLVIREGRYLMYNGENIGTLSTRQGGPKDATTTYSLRINFSSDSKFVSFPAAEYCLRCIGFENTNAKMNPGERHFQITLNCTGLKSTCDTVEKFTVVAYSSLLTNPSFASSIKYEEGLKPKPILKQASTGLATTLTQKGYLKATILNPFDGDEVQIDPTHQEIKVKDGRSVLLGKESVANIPSTRKSQSSIQIDFLKVNNNTLQTLVRSLVYFGAMRNIDPTQRLIEIECSTGVDIELCTVTMTVDIMRRDEPAEFIVDVLGPPLVHMSGQPPSSLCASLLLNLKKSIPAAFELEVALPEKPKPGEHLGVQSTDDIDLVEDDEMQRLRFATNAGKCLAYIQKFKLRDDDCGAYLFAKNLAIVLATDLNAHEAKMLMNTVCYVNTSKSDRGSKKNISLAFRNKSTTVAKTILSLEIIAPILDFSNCPPTVHGHDGVPVAAACRLQLSLSLRQVEITFTVAAGYDYSDSIGFRFPSSDPYGFLIENDSALITNPQMIQQINAAANTNNGQQLQPSSSAQENALSSESSLTLLRSPSSSPVKRRSSLSQFSLPSGKNSVYLANVQTTTTTILILAEGTLSNSALQALMRSVVVSGEPKGDKDILVEVAVTSSCGQCRELVRVLM